MRQEYRPLDVRQSDRTDDADKSGGRHTRFAVVTSDVLLVGLAPHCSSIKDSIFHRHQAPVLLTAPNKRKQQSNKPHVEICMGQVAYMVVISQKKRQKKITRSLSLVKIGLVYTGVDLCPAIADMPDARLQRH